MNGKAIRHFYDCPFPENSRPWEPHTAALAEEQVFQPVSYSHGSIHSQIVHLLNVDNLVLRAARSGDSGTAGAGRLSILPSIIHIGGGRNQLEHIALRIA